MSLPKFLQPYLASYHLAQLDKDSPATSKEVITQVLNLGDDKAVRWLFENYSLETIKDVLSQPKRGTWFERSLYYWSKILGVKISPLIYQRAILDLNKL